MRFSGGKCFREDVLGLILLQVQTLCNLINHLTLVKINPVMIAFIAKLIVRFAAWVHNFQICTEVMLFAKDPFTLDAGESL